MLTWATQTYGFLTEYVSTPKAYVDKQNYKYPVGPHQLKKFAEGAADYGVTDYYRDPSALKLIDQTEWEVRLHMRSNTSVSCWLTTPLPCSGGPSDVQYQRRTRGSQWPSLHTHPLAAHGQLA